MYVYNAVARERYYSIHWLYPSIVVCFSCCTGTILLLQLSMARLLYSSCVTSDIMISSFGVAVANQCMHDRSTFAKMTMLDLSCVPCLQFDLLGVILASCLSTLQTRLVLHCSVKINILSLSLSLSLSHSHTHSLTHSLTHSALCSVQVCNYNCSLTFCMCVVMQSFVCFLHHRSSPESSNTSDISFFTHTSGIYNII